LSDHSCENDLFFIDLEDNCVRNYVVLHLRWIVPSVASGLVFERGGVPLRYRMYTIDRFVLRPPCAVCSEPEFPCLSESVLPSSFPSLASLILLIPSSTCHDSHGVQEDSFHLLLRFQRHVGLRLISLVSLRISPSFLEIAALTLIYIYARRIQTLMCRDSS
jgi:hypothetical protein